MRTTLIRLLLLGAGLPAACGSLRAQESEAAAAETARMTETVRETPADSTAHRPLTINEMRRRRGLTDTHNLFVPKGQWIFGGTASYSTHTNKSYQFLIIEGIDSKGYTFKISPMIAYAFRNNMALGGRFIYSRTLLKLDKAAINFGDADSNVSLNAQDYYALQHTYQVAAIWRQYIPLGRNKRFALYNEMSLAAGGSEARFANGSPVKGTYQSGYTLALGISP